MVTRLQFLRSVSLFSSLSHEQLEHFAESCTFRELDPYDYIWEEEQDSPTPFLVHSGRVLVGKSSSRGKELILNVLLSHDILSLLPALDSGSSRLFARAQTAAEVMIIPTLTLSLLLERRPALEAVFARQLAVQLRGAHDLCRAFAHDGVESRIAAALCALARKFQAEEAKNSEVAVYMRRQDLANISGVSLETAIRVTKAMEGDGLLDLSRRGLIRVLDPGALAERCV